MFTTSINPYLGLVMMRLRFQFHMGSGDGWWYCCGGVGVLHFWFVRWHKTAVQP